MKHWKKYLAAAGSAFVILALVMVINNNNSKEKTAVEQSTTEIKANVQTKVQTGEADSNSKESSTLLADEVNSSEQDTALNEKQSVSEEDIDSEIKKLINTYYETPGKEGKENSNTADQTAESQTSESQKSKADDKKSEIIEKYKNIKTYIKPGLNKESYVVFVTYDIKLYNIDTLVPGMSSLSVERDESGALYINDDSNDAKLKEHIIKLAKEKDIKTVIKEVNSKLTSAIDKDNSLKEFIDYLK
jgi:hypothetical protein